MHVVEEFVSLEVKEKTIQRSRNNSTIIIHLLSVGRKNSLNRLNRNSKM